MEPPAHLAQLLQAATFSTSSHTGPCSLSHIWRDDCLHLVIKGSASTNFPDEFTDAVEQLFHQLSPKRAAIDLTGTDHLPSVMLAFLVFFQKHAAEHGCPQVALYGANARITTMIRMIGMTDFFHSVPTADDARRWFASQT